MWTKTAQLIAWAVFSYAWSFAGSKQPITIDDKIIEVCVDVFLGYCSAYWLWRALIESPWRSRRIAQRLKLL